MFSLKEYSDLEQIPVEIRDSLKRYIWPPKYKFVKVFPPEALNIPEHYFVGDDPPSLKEIRKVASLSLSAVHPIIVWHCLKTNEVKAITTSNNLWLPEWQDTEILRYVIDLEGNKQPLGFFIPEEEDITLGIDTGEVNASELSVQMQLLFKERSRLSRQKGNNIPFISYREFLDSLPDDED